MKQEVIVLFLITIAGVMAITIPFWKPDSTGKYMHEQNIFVNEDNPCFMIGCRGHLGREAVLVGMQGTKYICACPEDILPDGSPRPGTAYYIQMVRKY